MSHHDDWFDDYMIMQMMEDDDCREGGAPSSNGAGCGCFPVALGVLAILWIFSKLIA